MARALTVMLGAMAADTASRLDSIEIPERKIHLVDPLKHNAGGCGCDSCGRGRVPGGNIPTFPASVVVGGKTATDWYGKEMEASGYDVAPYDDALADQMCMTPVSSGAPVTIAAAASAVLTIGPTRGWLDMFYIKIVGLNPVTGVEVDPASYRLTPPRVADCPQPCDNTAMRGAFYRGGGDECLGCRWRAIVGRNADGEALTLTITNDGIASATFQAVARGYCHARNLCL